MQAHHEHEFEAAPGLPEALPAGEYIVWQGGPDWRKLAADAFHVPRLAAYFSAMIALQALLSWDAAAPLAGNVVPLLISASLALTALGLLSLTAWLSARTTMYTLTNKRVVMRIGIVLSISLNLPLRWLAAARLKADQDGVGNIALELKGDDGLGYLHLWPHALAWHLSRPQPSLRCVRDAAVVGQQLEQAWRRRLAEVGEIDAHERIPVRMPAMAMAR